MDKRTFLKANISGATPGVLNRAGAGPVLVQNLGYFGYPRNCGFTLMPSEVRASIDLGETQ